MFPAKSRKTSSRRSSLGGLINPSESDAVSGTFQIAPASARPFVLCEYPGPAALNERLRRLFLERETAGDRYANPQPLVQRNEALWESNFQLFDWPDPPVAELRDYCWAQLYRAIRELIGYDLEQLRKLHVSAEAWFHITRKGGYLVMFPSWVLHEVRPYFGDGERITVAFNARFKMAGIEPGKMPIYRA